MVEKMRERQDDEIVLGAGNGSALSYVLFC
jgi:hypothetical protein